MKLGLQSTNISTKTANFHLFIKFLKTRNYKDYNRRPGLSVFITIIKKKKEGQSFLVSTGSNKQNKHLGNWLGMGPPPGPQSGVLTWEK